MNHAIFWRLVWKEYRMQRAFWISMVLLTFLIQMLQHAFSDVDRTSPTTVTWTYALALLFTALYAAGCGATIFSTERETGTYEFQRSIPVSWRQLFVAKGTFAVLSILAILTVLLFMADWIAQWNLPGERHAAILWALFGFAIIELLLWGMFYSLVMDQPLVAALLTMATVSIYVHIFATSAFLSPDRAPDQEWGYVRVLPLRIAIAMAVAFVDIWLARQWLRRGDAKLSFGGWRLLGSTGCSSASVADTGGQADISAAAAIASGGKPTKPSGEVLFRRLVWQQWRQSRRMLLVVAVAAIALVGIGMGLSGVPPFNYGEKPRLITILASLLAGLMGTFVFLGDQRHQRFLFFAEHGARPSYVWLSRQVVWFLPVLLLVGLLFPVFLMTNNNQHEVWDVVGHVGDHLTLANQLGIHIISIKCLGELLVCVPLAYAAGQFCSLFFKSGILAGVFGLGLAMALCAWTLLMRFLQINLLWSAAPLAVALLAATWLRTSSWIVHRNSLRAWIPIGAVVLLPVAAILAAVPQARIATVPIVGRLFPADDLTRGLTPEEQTTREMYQRAMDIVQPQAHSTDSGTQVTPDDNQPKPPQPATPPKLSAREIAWVKNNTKAIDATIAATRRPLGDKLNPPRPDYSVMWHGNKYYQLIALLLNAAQAAQSQGDLDAAMERYLATLRLIGYMRYYTMSTIFNAAWQEYDVYEHLRYWAIQPGQTPQRLRAMNRDLGDVVRSFPPLGLDARKQRRLVLDILAGNPDARMALDRNKHAIFRIELCSRWFPWEITRERRLLDDDMMHDWWFYEEWLEPRGVDSLWLEQRGVIQLMSSEYNTIQQNLFLRREDLLGLNALHPHQRIFYGFPHEYRELVAHRRAIRLILALNAWRLEHGRLPDSLGALIGSELQELPRDPYSGGPFKYLPAGLPFPLVSCGRSNWDWKIYPANTPMLASTTMELQFGTFPPNAYETPAPSMEKWAAERNAWFAQPVYPFPQPQKAADTGQKAGSPR